MKRKELELKAILQGIERIFNIMSSDQAPILELLSKWQNVPFGSKSIETIYLLKSHTNFHVA